MQKADDSLSTGSKELFDINESVSWILKNKFTKVCLQFPDSLLVDSVDIADTIESLTGQKVFILADTTYGSCCVDEIACLHVNGDAVIHYGHACLSPVDNLPVFYVFPKREFSVDKFILRFRRLKPSLPCLVLYDVGYAHIFDELHTQIAERLNDVCVSELIHEGHNNDCSCWCSAPARGFHNSALFQRGFCYPEGKAFESVIYIGSHCQLNFSNFQITMMGSIFYEYSHENGGFREIKCNDTMKKTSYLVEKIKDAHSIGIMVATLGVQGYREAIDYVKMLCRIKNKESFIISVGHPNPAKLANFPEIDVFVSIACPESDWGDPKEYLKPIVGLFEFDLALNDSRTWDNAFSRDFRDIIPGGAFHVKPQLLNESNHPEVSLTSTRLQVNASGEISRKEISGELALRQDMSVAMKEQYHKRTWDGLEQKIGKDAPAILECGRTGVDMKSSGGTFLGSIEVNPVIIQAATWATMNRPYIPLRRGERASDTGNLSNRVVPTSVCHKQVRCVKESRALVKQTFCRRHVVPESSVHDSENTVHDSESSQPRQGAFNISSSCDEPSVNTEPPSFSNNTVSCVSPTPVSSMRTTETDIVTEDISSLDDKCYPPLFSVTNPFSESDSETDEDKYSQKDVKEDLHRQDSQPLFSAESSNASLETEKKECDTLPPCDFMNVIDEAINIFFKPNNFKADKLNKAVQICGQSSDFKIDSAIEKELTCRLETTRKKLEQLRLAQIFVQEAKDKVKAKTAELQSWEEKTMERLREAEDVHLCIRHRAEQKILDMSQIEAQYSEEIDRIRRCLDETKQQLRTKLKCISDEKTYICADIERVRENELETKKRLLADAALLGTAEAQNHGDIQLAIQALCDAKNKAEEKSNEIAMWEKEKKREMKMLRDAEYQLRIAMDAEITRLLDLEEQKKRELANIRKGICVAVMKVEEVAQTCIDNKRQWIKDIENVKNSGLCAIKKAELNVRLKEEKEQQIKCELEAEKIGFLESRRKAQLEIIKIAELESRKQAELETLRTIEFQTEKRKEIEKVLIDLHNSLKKAEDEALQQAKCEEMKHNQVMHLKTALECAQKQMNNCQDGGPRKGRKNLINFQVHGLEEAFKSSCGTPQPSEQKEPCTESQIKKDYFLTDKVEEIAEKMKDWGISCNSYDDYTVPLVDFLPTKAPRDPSSDSSSSNNESSNDTFQPAGPSGIQANNASVQIPPVTVEKGVEIKERGTETQQLDKNDDNLIFRKDLDRSGVGQYKDSRTMWSDKKYFSTPSEKNTDMKIATAEVSKILQSAHSGLFISEQKPITMRPDDLARLILSLEKQIGKDNELKSSQKIPTNIVVDSQKNQQSKSTKKDNAQSQSLYDFGIKNANHLGFQKQIAETKQPQNSQQLPNQKSKRPYTPREVGNIEQEAKSRAQTPNRKSHRSPLPPEHTNPTVGYTSAEPENRTTSRKGRLGSPDNNHKSNYKSSKPMSTSNRRDNSTKYSKQDTHPVRESSKPRNLVEEKTETKYYESINQIQRQQRSVKGEESLDPICKKRVKPSDQGKIKYNYLRRDCQCPPTKYSEPEETISSKSSSTSSEIYVPEPPRVIPPPSPPEIKMEVVAIGIQTSICRNGQLIDDGDVTTQRSLTDSEVSSKIDDVSVLLNKVSKNQIAVPPVLNTLLYEPYELQSIRHDSDDALTKEQLPEHEACSDRITRRGLITKDFLECLMDCILDGRIALVPQGSQMATRYGRTTRNSKHEHHAKRRRKKHHHRDHNYIESHATSREKKSVAVQTRPFTSVGTQTDPEESNIPEPEKTVVAIETLPIVIKSPKTVVFMESSNVLDESQPDKDSVELYTRMTKKLPKPTFRTLEFKWQPTTKPAIFYKIKYEYKVEIRKIKELLHYSDNDLIVDEDGSYIWEEWLSKMDFSALKWPMIVKTYMLDKDPIEVIESYEGLVYGDVEMDLLLRERAKKVNDSWRDTYGFRRRSTESASLGSRRGSLIFKHLEEQLKGPEEIILEEIVIEEIEERSTIRSSESVPSAFDMRNLDEYSMRTHRSKNPKGDHVKRKHKHLPKNNSNNTDLRISASSHEKDDDTNSVITYTVPVKSEYSSKYKDTRESLISNSLGSVPYDQRHSIFSYDRRIYDEEHSEKYHDDINYSEVEKLDEKKDRKVAFSVKEDKPPEPAKKPEPKAKEDGTEWQKDAADLKVGWLELRAIVEKQPPPQDTSVASDVTDVASKSIEPVDRTRKIRFDQATPPGSKDDTQALSRTPLDNLKPKTVRPGTSTPRNEDVKSTSTQASSPPAMRNKIGFSGHPELEATLSQELAVLIGQKDNTSAAPRSVTPSHGKNPAHSPIVESPTHTTSPVVDSNKRAGDKELPKEVKRGQVRVITSTQPSLASTSVYSSAPSPPPLKTHVFHDPRYQERIDSRQKASAPYRQSQDYQRSSGKHQEVASHQKETLYGGDSHKLPSVPSHHGGHHSRDSKVTENHVDSGLRHHEIAPKQPEHITDNHSKTGDHGIARRQSEHPTSSHSTVGFQGSALRDHHTVSHSPGGHGSNVRESEPHEKAHHDPGHHQPDKRELGHGHDGPSAVKKSSHVHRDHSLSHQGSVKKESHHHSDNPSSSGNFVQTRRQSSQQIHNTRGAGQHATNQQAQPKSDSNHLEKHSDKSHSGARFVQSIHSGEAHSHIINLGHEHETKFAAIKPQHTISGTEHKSAGPSVQPGPSRIRNVTTEDSERTLSRTITLLPSQGGIKARFKKINEQEEEVSSLKNFQQTAETESASNKQVHKRQQSNLDLNREIMEILLQPTRKKSYEKSSKSRTKERKSKGSIPKLKTNEKKGESSITSKSNAVEKKSEDGKN